MRKPLICFALVFLFFCHTVVAEPLNKEKTYLMDRLLEQSGQTAEAVGMQMASVSVQQMFTSLQTINPNIDQKILDIMEDVVVDVIREELVVKKGYVKMMYPIYDKYFTQDDLKQMLKYNSTPIGKKTIKVMPMIMQEAIQASQAFTKTLDPMIMQRLAAKLKEEGMQ